MPPGRQLPSRRLQGPLRPCPLHPPVPGHAKEVVPVPCHLQALLQLLCRPGRPNRTKDGGSSAVRDAELLRACLQQPIHGKTCLLDLERCSPRRFGRRRLREPEQLTAAGAWSISGRPGRFHAHAVSANRTAVGFSLRGSRRNPHVRISPASGEVNCLVALYPSAALPGQHGPGRPLHDHHRHLPELLNPLCTIF
jgi:hypothetical protein